MIFCHFLRTVAFTTLQLAIKCSFGIKGNKKSQHTVDIIYYDDA
jgi:hypothetical protein